MYRLVGGASVPAGNNSEIIAALNKVADLYKINPAAIAAMIHTESKWDAQCVTGSYFGLTQVGSEVPKSLQLTKKKFLELSAGEQIEFYGKWLKYYRFLEQLDKYEMNVSDQAVARQAAVLQAMQFAPNGTKWKIAFARGDLSVPSTSAKQARFLGDTSIHDMEAYYKSFFEKHPPEYETGGIAAAAVAAGVAMAPPTTGAVAEKTIVVATEGLHFRSTAEGGTDRNIIAELDYGDRAVIRGAPMERGFVKAVVELNGTSTAGYLHQRYLRDEETPPIESAIREAVREWRRFDKGNGVEYLEPYSGYINEYWSARGQPKLTGKDRESPWSAVFISFVLEKAGYQHTQFDIRHSTYIHQAIQNRVTRAEGDFWALRVDEAKPEVGDIVCQWRGARITYDMAETRSRFESHTDIVIAVRDRAIVTLGGNVTNASSGNEGVSVETKTFELDTAGFLAGPSRVFAVMKNRHRANV